MKTNLHVNYAERVFINGTQLVNWYLVWQRGGTFNDCLGGFTVFHADGCEPSNEEDHGEHFSGVQDYFVAEAKLWNYGIEEMLSLFEEEAASRSMFIRTRRETK